MLAPRRRQLVAGICGTALLALLLLVASLDAILGSARPPEQIPLFTVQMYEPPPAAPPPPTARSDGGSGDRRSLVQGLAPQNAGINLDIMELDADVRLGAGISGMSGEFGSGLGGIGDGEGISAMFMASLGELDSMPVVVFAPGVDRRQFFRDTGVSHFTVRFHIAIDTEGQATPLGIVENPLPQLEAALLRYAEQVRFTPPLRAGVPVRTEYIWPVNFVDDAGTGTQAIRRGGLP